MTRELVLIAHALERAVERVFADGMLEAPVARDEVDLSWLALVQQVPNDLLGLHRQRHDVRRDIHQALALLLGEQRAA